MPKKRNGDHPITPEEEDEWQKEMQMAMPLKARPKQLKQVKKPQRPALRDQPLRVDRPAKANNFPAISLGSYAGVDKNTREKFRKGEFDIDGRLDLHGYTRDAARRKVEDFIHRHYNQGSRMLLIITGKGTLGKNMDEPATGVLRQSLPGWLEEDEIRPFILAFDKATIKDGGSGAFYVLLRRRRD